MRALLPTIVACAVAGAPSTVQAQRADTSRVSVNATAGRLVPPERALVFLEVGAEGSPGAVVALAAADARNSVIEALAAAGYGSDRVSVWGYGAGPTTDVPGRMMPSPDAAGSFEAKVGLRVVVAPKQVDEVVSVALSAGAKSVVAVLFDAEGADGVRAEVLAEAVRAARREAEIMATAAGGELGELISLTNTINRGEIASQDRLLSSAGYPGQPVRIAPVNVSVRVTVQGSWVFLPR